MIFANPIVLLEPGLLRLHCSSTLPGSTIVIAKVQNDGSWWLLNDGTDDVTLATNKELFGFNTGSFNEVPAGQIFVSLSHILQYQPRSYRKQLCFQIYFE